MKKKLNYGALIDGKKRYPVDYTIKQDGTKVFKKTKLLGSELTEKQAQKALLIHPAFSKSEIAYRYYKIVHPDREYSKEKARIQFQQDNKLNLKTVRHVIDELYSEQKQLLATIGKA